MLNHRITESWCNVNQNDNKLGANIKCLRVEHYESRQNLARILCCSEKTIRNYEQGDRKSDLERLHAIAYHYAVPIELLIAGDFSELNVALEAGQTLVDSHIRL